MYLLELRLATVSFIHKFVRLLNQLPKVPQERRAGHSWVQKRTFKWCKYFINSQFLKTTLLHNQPFEDTQQRQQVADNLILSLSENCLDTLIIYK